MFARTLVKLIDYAIFPAFLLVAAKILSIVFLSRYFNAAYQVDGLRLAFNNVEDFIAINSYSSLFMLATVTGGLLWIIVKAHIFHETHITPSLSAKLFNLNLEELIHTTETIYSQSFIWLSYVWLVTIVLGLYSYYELSYWWVFYIGMGVSVVSTVLLVLDFEKELKDDKKILDKPPVANRLVTLREIREEVLL